MGQFLSRVKQSMRVLGGEIIKFALIISGFVHSSLFILESPENGKLSGKFWRVLKQSGKWEMTLKNLESFETVRKMGYDLEKSRQF